MVNAYHEWYARTIVDTPKSAIVPLSKLMFGPAGL
jgi:hypothetical protein